MGDGGAQFSATYVRHSGWRSTVDASTAGMGPGAERGRTATHNFNRGESRVTEYKLGVKMVVLLRCITSGEH